MKPDRWAQIEACFHAALERSASEREAFLSQACAGDEELRREVAALLAFDDPTGRFIKAPALPRGVLQADLPANGEFSTARAVEGHLSDTPRNEGKVVDSWHPGEVIRNFRIERKIGEGGMGEVYLAWNLKLGRNVALKLLPAGAGPDDQSRERFLREVRAASALNHPNIVTIYSVEELDGSNVIDMEYVEGESLRDRLLRGPLDLPEVIELGIQLADAVAVAHRAAIIHRDLKPGNILITPAGQAKIVDFGLAKRVDAAALTAPEDGPGGIPKGHDVTSHALTRSGSITGTVPYMSPEQTRGEPLDTRTDLFSLGCVLYEAATGKRPFDGPDAMAIVRAIGLENPPPPSAVRPGLTRGFDRLVERAMAKNREQRFASALELAAALRRLSAMHSARSAVKRLGIPALVTLALLAAGGIWTYWRHANVEFAKAQVPHIKELADDERYFEAYDLARLAGRYLPEDGALRELAPRITDVLSVATDPPGASVYLRRYARDDGGKYPPRALVGTTPIVDLPIARGPYLLTIEKNGYATYARTLSSALDRAENGLWTPGELREAKLVEGPGQKFGVRLDSNAPIRLDVKLLESQTVPERTVFVPGREYELVCWSRPIRESIRLDDFFIDQFEVTNREFKEFIDAGGYQNRAYWKHPFVEDGKRVSWEEGLARMVDSTGRPGPRGWSAQTCPEGRDEHPVTGVTWYEAAAYAEFRGKSLPTVFQWELAARDGKSTVLWEAVMPWGFSGPHENVADRANVNGTGTAPVESYEFGISPYGCYHMAGNVTEWCLNERPNGFTTAGGSWREGPHFFGLLGQYPGFYSIESLGFRCVLNSAEARGDQGGMFLKDKDQIPEFHPVDDDAFQAILRHYRYDDSPLGAKIVESVETSDWRREKFTYRGAGGRRALAYLYLPHGAARPLQMINYKPGGAVYAGLFVPQEVEVVCAPFIKSGRAVLVAVLEGMRERDYPAGYEEPKPTSVRFREVQVADTIDERRAIDYVASRGDIDINHVACMGLSMGGFDIVSMAVENRYQSILLLSAGLNTDLSTAIPEANPVNFAPQIAVPKLMIHGRYDEGAPFRTTAQPLFNLFREPKELRALDTGHFPPMDLWVPIAQEWFDKKLGAVTKR